MLNSACIAYPTQSTKFINKANVSDWQPLQICMQMLRTELLANMGFVHYSKGTKKPLMTEQNATMLFYFVSFFFQGRALPEFHCFWVTKLQSSTQFPARRG